ncbi:hypothetical protein RUND412_010925 [Rhizina undulata]
MFYREDVFLLVRGGIHICTSPAPKTACAPPTPSGSSAEQTSPPSQIYPPSPPPRALPRRICRRFRTTAISAVRAALCRKRILIITTAPVERGCKFVYNISVISNIPSAVHEKLRESPKRLRPLFVVGVNDIPFLEGEGDGEGWVACTTDHVLKLKAQLYDVVVTFPSAPTWNAANWNGYPGNGKTKLVWPTLDNSRRRRDKSYTLLKSVPVCSQNIYFSVIFHFRFTGRP